MAADILLVLISLSDCLTSSVTSDFYFGCLIWRAFASVKSSSSISCFDRQLRVCLLDGSEFWNWIRLFRIGIFIDQKRTCDLEN